MFPAVKQFDPVLGIDTHLVLIPTPAGPVPTPIPHPFVGLVFDPQEWLPIQGATVYINGVPRGVAGSAVKATPPHIPMGGAFVKPPGNEGELYMGSSTVLMEGEPAAYTALPVLTCQDIGMPAPLRLKKKSAPKSLMLPTSLVMAVPAGPLVLIGGAPTISMPSAGEQLSAGAKMMKQLLQKSRKGRRLLAHTNRKLKGASRYLNQLADRAFAKLGLSREGLLRNAVRRGICSITGHPVDIATGKVFTDFVDLELPGPLPFELERVWFSTSTYQGPLGHGWHASYDMALAEDAGVVCVRLEDGRAVLFPALARGEAHFDGRERLTLRRDDAGYCVESVANGRTYKFSAVRERDVLPLAAIEDRQGFTITFRYERGLLTQIIDASGRPWDFRYDPQTLRLIRIEGPHRSRSDQRSVYAQYEYDGRGNLVEVRDAYDQPQRFVYRDHLLVRETNRNGLSFYFEWDGKDAMARCTRTWGDGGIYDHKLTYDTMLDTTTVENSLGYKTQYVHDGNMVHRTLDAFGNERLTEYGVGYRVLAEVDELGQRTSHEYDERGNLLQSMTPEGAVVALRYDEHDLPVSATDALGGTWSWLRDERGRVLERRNPLGEVVRYEYQGPWLVGVVDAAGHRTTLGYDTSGNLAALGTGTAMTRFQHDRVGRVIAVTDANGAVSRREYDALGRTVRLNEADGNERTFAHDPEGNIIRARDKQHDVRFTYVGMNRLASRTEAGTTVRFEYDTEEQLIAIQNEHGAVYRFKLGPTGLVEEEHGFDGLIRKYVRDKAGRVIRVERAAQRSSDYVLNPVGRVTEINHSDGSRELFQYQKDGSLLVAANEEGIVRFTRDALGRVVKEEFDGRSIVSKYDALGHRIHLRSSLGAEQSIERGVMGDVTRVAETTSGFEACFGRDALGLEVARSLPGGVRSRWERDGVGRPVAHIVEKIGDGSIETLRAVGYRWDVNDRLRTLIDGLRGPTEYHHDTLGNLAWARYPDGTYDLRMPDAVGNLFKTEQRGDRKYGPAGQLLVAWSKAGETRYGYDPEGNLIEKREPNGARWQYQWTARGMLRSVTRPDGSRVRFAYDALGRRVKKTYRGQTTRWVWDGNVPLHEWVEGRLEQLEESADVILASKGAAIERREAELDSLLAQGPPARGSVETPITWLFEPESFAPLAKLVGGVQQSIVCDHLGTPVLMVDDRGERVWSASIDVYGRLREVAGERWACPFRWPGQYEDAETGLYYNRFRYYDAEAGQYLAQDPIGLAGGLALYGYVQDPLWWLDPFGLASCAASSLPKLRGRNVAETEQLLQKHGFVRTHISNSAGKNQTWKHADGSVVKIHPYGDQATKPWKTANNGHIHKYNSAGEALNDRGVPASVLESRGNPTQGKETHIGIRNPSDLPTVRGRPHGAGS